MTTVVGKKIKYYECQKFCAKAEYGVCTTHTNKSPPADQSRTFQIGTDSIVDAIVLVIVPQVVSKMHYSNKHVQKP